MKAWTVLLLSFLTVLNLQADRTFVWTGDDPRFSGWFSIAEGDFQRRSFENITAARYSFQNDQNPSLNVVLDDPRGFYQGNVVGRLTPDGNNLRHDLLPSHPNGSFWVAVWKYPGISVGMYGHNQGEPVEYFTYANHEANFIVDSTGKWTLVPEPSAAQLMVASLCIAGVARLIRRQPSA